MQAKIIYPIQVSVIIPCYKDSTTLRGAIESILNQTYQDFEIIVVNDASPETAGIEEILKNYPSVVYVKNDHNLGLAGARNVGIKKANGVYIAFLDADDEYHPRKLELQRRYIEDNTAIACDVQIFKEQRPKITIFKQVDKANIREVFGDFKFCFQNYLTGASILAPKLLLLKAGGYDESLRSCEDYDLWLRLLSLNVKLIHLRLPLYYYRFNPDGLSKNVNAISFWELEAVKRHLKRNARSLKFRFLKYPIWISWLCRHLIRATREKNDELRILTLKNASAPTAPPFLYIPIQLINFFRVPEIYCKISKRFIHSVRLR